MSGVKFGIYSDSTASTKVGEMTTAADTGTQRNIQKEIDEWMSFKKMSERQILEFYKRLSWILKI